MVGNLTMGDRLKLPSNFRQWQLFGASNIILPPWPPLDKIAAIALATSWISTGAVLACPIGKDRVPLFFISGTNHRKFYMKEFDLTWTPRRRKIVPRAGRFFIIFAAQMAKIIPCRVEVRLKTVSNQRAAPPWFWWTDSWTDSWTNLYIHPIDFLRDIPHAWGYFLCFPCWLKFISLSSCLQSWFCLV